MGISWRATTALFVVISSLGLAKAGNDKRTATAPSRDTSGIRHYYVSPSGRDSNNGSQTRPWATIQHADSALRLGTNGTVVHVLPGVYNQDIKAMHNGTPTQRIKFESETPYDARINAFWMEQGNYVDIVGFDITAPTGAAVWFGCCGSANDPSRGNYDSFRHNRVHDVNTICAGQVGGAVGTYKLTHDVTFDSNIIDRVGVWGGGCAGDDGTGSHGIYISGFRATVTNNIISGAAGYGIHAYHNSCQQVIANNTVLHNYVGGILLSAGPESDMSCNGAADYSSVNNNLVIRNGFGCGVSRTPGIPGIAAGIVIYNAGRIPNTKVYNNYLASNWNGGGDSGCVYKPGTNNNVLSLGSTWGFSQGGNVSSTTYTNLVVNYQDSAAAGDFHLSKDSPGKRRGTGSSCPPSPGISDCIPAADLDNRPRTPGSGIDVGAYQTP